MIVTNQGKPGCNHKWCYFLDANTQWCNVCGRCETPNP